MKKKLRLLLIVLFAVLFLFSAWQVFGILQTYQKSQTSYDALEEYVSFGNTEAPEVSPESTDGTAPIETEPMELPDISAWPQVDFDELSKINPEIVGWIYIEGTDIKYPVVQGTDNDYYLKHLLTAPIIVPAVSSWTTAALLTSLTGTALFTATT